MNKSAIVIEPGTPSFSLEAGKLIYESSHELMDFMFSGQEVAEKTLAVLYQKKRGHFSHVFSTTAMKENQFVGIELGYDKNQLAKQDLIGGILLLLKSPPSIWWHVITKVGSVVDGYVPKPGDDAYYINNIAVSSACRGGGIGLLLLEDAIRRANENGYRCVELDVTSVNEGAIRFYEKHGFAAVSESGSRELHEKYGLPPLIRMVRKF